MSWQAVKWAFDIDLDGPAKAVLVGLAYHMNADGVAWPSISLLARETGWCPNTVRRAIQHLAEQQIITVSHRPGRALSVHVGALSQEPTALSDDAKRALSLRGNHKEHKRTGDAARANGAAPPKVEPATDVPCTIASADTWLSHLAESRANLNSQVHPSKKRKGP